MYGEKIRNDTLHNCLVNNRGQPLSVVNLGGWVGVFLLVLGLPDSNVEIDLCVEHWNAVLKTRLAALGGRYTEEAISRIGASLNLASLLEEKLYPTYSERLGNNQSKSIPSLNFLC